MEKLSSVMLFYESAVQVSRACSLYCTTMGVGGSDGLPYSFSFLILHNRVGPSVY